MLRDIWEKIRDIGINNAIVIFIAIFIIIGIALSFIM